MINKSFLCKNIEELKNIASLIIKFAANNKFFALYGEMGAGKTTFIKIACDILGSQSLVTSPTFSLINEYPTQNNGIIFHFDFYRIKSLEEVYDIGYEDYFFSNNYCFVEWSEKVQSLLPQKNIVMINISENIDGSRAFDCKIK